MKGDGPGCWSLEAYHSTTGTYLSPPLVLAPSHLKIAYDSGLRAFWDGLAPFGWVWKGGCDVSCFTTEPRQFTLSAVGLLSRGVFAGGFVQMQLSMT